MPGVDLVLPEFTYLREQGRPGGRHRPHPRPRGPHRGLAYLLRDLEVPIYGSELTVGPGPAPGRRGRPGPPDGVHRRERRRAPASGPAMSSSSRSPTRSPMRFAIAFHTPQGVILHSGDFKLDLQPVDGRRTDLARIGALAETAASGSCCRTRPTPRSRASPNRSHRRGRPCVRVFASQTRHGSWWPASPATSTGSSRSSTPPSPTAARWRRSDVRWARTSSWVPARHHHVPKGALIDIEQSTRPAGPDVRDLHRFPG